MFSARRNNLKTWAKTLRFRLTVWNIAVILLTAVATLLGVRSGVRLTILNEMDQILVEDVYEIEFKLSDAGIKVTDLQPAAAGRHRPKVQNVLDDLDRKARGHEKHGWFVKLCDPHGTVLWTSTGAPGPLPLPRGLKNFEPVTVDGFRVVENQETQGRFSPLRVMVGAEIDFLERDMSRIDRLVAMVAGIVLLIAPPLGYWLAGRTTRPLASIIRTAARLRPTCFEERLAIRNTGDELDQLAVTVNGMLDRIADYLEHRRDFLANAAHELRSPLAAIRSTAEVALGEQRSREEYENLLCDVVEECESLQSLVNQLLLLAETENISSQMQGTIANLSGITERGCDMFLALAESRGVELQANIEPDVRVRGNEYHLRQVLNNLVDNALKFTSPGDRVTVDLQRRGDRCVLTVADTGHGVPAEDLPHLFERFFRGDRSHSRSTETRGTGLGLSICQAIVEGLGGTISVASTLGAGTTFTVTLPTVTESPATEDPVELPAVA